MERKVVIFDHPLIQHKLSILRNENTSTKDFRELVNEIAMLMTFEATRDLPTEQVDVKTPCGIAKCNHIAGRKLAFVPILRAGLGMVDGCVSLVPAARIGHIGLNIIANYRRILTRETFTLLTRCLQQAARQSTLSVKSN